MNLGIRTVFVCALATLTPISCGLQESVDIDQRETRMQQAQTEEVLTPQEREVVRHYVGRVMADADLADALTVIFMGVYSTTEESAGPIAVMNVGLNFRDQMISAIGRPERGNESVWLQLAGDLLSEMGGTRGQAAAVALQVLPHVHAGIKDLAGETVYKEWAQNLAFSPFGTDFGHVDATSVEISANLESALTETVTYALIAYKNGDTSALTALQDFSFKSSTIACVPSVDALNSCIKGSYGTRLQAVQNGDSWSNATGTLSNIETMVQKVVNNEEFTETQKAELNAAITAEGTRLGNIMNANLEATKSALEDLDQIQLGVSVNGQKLDKLDKDLTSLFEYFVEEEYIEIAEAAQVAYAQIEYEATSVYVQLLSSLAYHVDPELGKAVGVTLNAGLRITNAFAQHSASLAKIKQAADLGLFASSMEAATAMSTAALTGNVVLIGLEVLSALSPGQTPEQIIIERLEMLSQQVANLGEHMDTRFNYVDGELAGIHDTLSSQFELIAQRQEKTQEEIQSVKAVLMDLRNEMTHLVLRIEEQLRTQYLLNFELAEDNILDWDEKYLTPLKEDDWKNAENVFYTAAVTQALGSVFAGEVDTPRSYTDIDVVDELASGDLNLEINYLNQYPVHADGIDGTYLAVGDTYESGQMRIANPVLWRRAAHAYAQLAEENPEFTQENLLASKFLDVMDRGNELITAFENMGDQTLFLSLLEKYEEKWLALEEAVATKSAELQTGPRPGSTYLLDYIDIWDGPFQLPSNATAELLSVMSDENNNRPPSTSYISVAEQEKVVCELKSTYRVQPLILAHHMRFLNDATQELSNDISLKVTNKVATSTPWHFQSELGLYVCADNVRYTLEVDVHGTRVMDLDLRQTDTRTASEKPTEACPADASSKAYVGFPKIYAEFDAIANDAVERNSVELSSIRQEVYEDLADAFSDPDLSNPVAAAAKELNGIKKVMQLYAQRGLGKILMRSEDVRAGIMGPGLRNGDEVQQLVKNIGEVHEILTEWEQGGVDPFAGIDPRPEHVEPRTSNLTADIFNPQYIENFRAKLNNAYEYLSAPYAYTNDLELAVGRLNAVRPCVSTDESTEERISFDPCPDGEPGFAKYSCVDSAWVYLECVTASGVSDQISRVVALYSSMLGREPTNDEVQTLRILFEEDRRYYLATSVEMSMLIEEIYATEVGRPMTLEEHATAIELLTESEWSPADVRAMVHASQEAADFRAAIMAVLSILLD